jgi:hypothetical protein
LRKWFIGFGMAAVAILLGIGWGMSGVINLRGTIWCFIFSAIILTAMLWVGEGFSQIPRPWELVLGCFGTQLICIGLLISIHFVLMAQPTPPVENQEPKNEVIIAPSEQHTTEDKVEVKSHPTPVRPVKAPLEIVEFNSSHNISIANNGPLSVYVMRLLINVTEPKSSKSFGLDFEIEPEKTKSIRIGDGFQNVRTLKKPSRYLEGTSC